MSEESKASFSSWEAKRASLQTRNYYGIYPINYSSLINSYLPLKQAVSGLNDDCSSSEMGISSKYPRINWNDERQVVAVTQAILHQDFRLKVLLPLGHLCPPIPRSLNYIQWVHHLLITCRQFMASTLPEILTDIEAGQWTDLEELYGKITTEEEGVLLGLIRECCTLESLQLCCIPKEDTNLTLLDIGTGASCIFPLLVARLYQWRSLATDVDPSSLASAARILQENGLTSFIHLLRSSSPSQILEGVVPQFSSSLPFTASPVTTPPTSSSIPCPSSTDVTAEWSALPSPLPVPPSSLPSSLPTSVTSLYPLSVLVCNPPFFDTNETTTTQPLHRDRYLGSETTPSPSSATSPSPSSPANPTTSPSSSSSLLSPSVPVSRGRFGGSIQRITAATPYELSCPGGEFSFVSQIIHESSRHPLSCYLYTTMLGKKASINPLKALLSSSEMKATAIANLPTDLSALLTLFMEPVITTPSTSSSSSPSIASSCGLRLMPYPLVFHHEYKQGNQARWAIAWSFNPLLWMAVSKQPLLWAKQVTDVCQTIDIGKSLDVSNQHVRVDRPGKQQPKREQQKYTHRYDRHHRQQDLEKEQKYSEGTGRDMKPSDDDNDVVINLQTKRLRGEASESIRGEKGNEEEEKEEEQEEGKGRLCDSRPTVADDNNREASSDDVPSAKRRRTDSSIGELP